MSVNEVLLGAEFADLVEDIRSNGLMEPIVMHEGKILDGRNRYRACEASGVKPRFIQFDGSVSPISFIVSLNLHRRHLSESQRGMAADKLANLHKGRPLKNTQIDVFPEGDNQYPNKEDAQICAPISQKQAADLLNVGQRTVQKARTVRSQGIPELETTVQSGKVALNAAEKLAKLPPDEQKAALEAPKPKAPVEKPKPCSTVIVLPNGNRLVSDALTFAVMSISQLESKIDRLYGFSGCESDKSLYYAGVSSMLASPVRIDASRYGEVP